ncbi:hypothetical protein GOP47_0014125 [Adiantum capillus-veneris]|uniref:Uncharacterized protein n=1 Tax=Adiantum capillus-veneris TaxID=13818 RepID=A0A9D4ZE14_ADICA|nr:hypothetical protein GOP47_0014125 [Adiantum capillus-veneris]
MPKKSESSDKKVLPPQLSLLHTRASPKRAQSKTLHTFRSSRLPLLISLPQLQTDHLPSIFYSAFLDCKLTIAMPTSLEVIVGSLQQTSPAMAGSSSFITIKPFHLTFEFVRSYKQPLPPLQASMASKEDRGAEERESRSSVSSLLKAVQEGHGPNAVMQQVSSLRHFFMPELPFALITELKKRMPLSFREDIDEGEMQRSGGLDVVEKDLEEQLTTVMGPRCAWPREKLIVSVVEVQEADGAQANIAGGPRCAWPRESAHALASLQKSFLQEEDVARNENAASGAKCAWPRETSRTQHPQERELSSCRSAQEGNLVSFKKSTEVTAFVAEDLKDVSAARHQESNSAVVEGPRCAWPRSTPRRMLATGVGIGIMNYLFIGQGAPALAIVLQSLSPYHDIICEEKDSLNPRKSLRP